MVKFLRVMAIVGFVASVLGLAMSLALKDWTFAFINVVFGVLNAFNYLNLEE